MPVLIFVTVCSEQLVRTHFCHISIQDVDNGKGRFIAKKTNKASTQITHQVQIYWYQMSKDAFSRPGT